MKKNYTLALTIVLLHAFTFLKAGVYYNWAKRFGDSGANIEVGKSITSDKNGNVYITGTFKGTVDFDPGNSVFNLIAGGSNDNIFFAKYNSNGNFIWAKQIGDANASNGIDIQVDDTGNVFLLANFSVSNSLDFDPGTSAFAITGQGNATLVFAKYKTNGDFVWAKGIEGAGDCIGTDLKLNAQGDIYISGKFTFNVDFDPSASPVILTAGSNQKGFLAKYYPNGDYHWAQKLDGGITEVTAFEISALGSIYITGSYRTSVDFDPSAASFIRSNDGNSDFFVACYTENGAFTWAIALDGINDDIGNTIALDNTNNIYIGGTFKDSLDTDPSAVDNFLVPASANDVDNFIAKYSSTGTYLWSFKYGNTETDYCNSLEADPYGAFYVSGLFKGSVDFDPGSGIALQDAGSNYNVYLAHYDTDGNYILAENIGGNNYDAANSLFLDEYSNLYLTGYFSDDVDFDNSALDTAVLSGGQGDIFMAKYSFTPPITLEKPFANSSWLVGDSYPIQWQSYGIDSVKIERQRQGQTTWEFIAKVGSTETPFSYNLLATNPLDLYTIRVSDAANKTVKSSAVVTIKFSPQLNYPVGGEVFSGDSIITINWFASGTTSAFFDLKYSINGGTNWFKIRDSVQTYYDNDSNFYIGNYNWKTPATINSSNCKVGIFTLNTSTLLFASAAFTLQPASPTSFTLLSPNGGEQLEKKKRYFITWTGTNMPPIVILYYTINGSSYNLIDTIPNLGYYEWRVVDSLSTTCKIKIKNISNTAFDLSNADFEIAASTADVAEITAPLLNDNWCAGTTHYITWNTNLLGKIKLIYKPGSGTDQLIDSVNASDGIYYWTVPNNPSVQNRIRIEPINSGSNLATSAEFDICSNTPSIEVLSPNGGESYYPGAYKAIHWNSNSIGLVSLDYSIDGGATWTLIEDSLVASPYYWLVPNAPSANCLIRASGTISAGFTDLSNASFTINAAFLGTPPFISTASIVSNVCKNSSFKVYFTVSGGIFDTSNIFIAQLSDSLGNFAGPVTTIGFVKDSISDSIVCSIPESARNSNLYRIRVVSDNPPTTGNTSPAFDLNSPQFTFKDTVKYYYLPNAIASFPNLTPPAGSSIEWNFGDGSTSFASQPNHAYTSSGIFDVSVKITGTNGCATQVSNRSYIRVDKKFPNRILNPNKTISISSISVKNDSTGSISFEDGTVKFTNDYGLNWYSVQPTGLSSVKAIKVKNAFEWLVVGDNGGVRKTVNRGLSWDTVTFALGSTPTVNLNAIDFSSQLSGYIAGDSGKVYRFVNGKFNPAPQFTNANLYTVSDNGVSAFVAGDSGTIVKRSSGVWTQKPSGITTPIRSLIFAEKDFNKGYAVGDSGKIIQSNDAGETWNVSLAGVEINFTSVACSEYGDSAWAVGEAGLIYQTLDNGLTWERFSKGSTSNNTNVRFKKGNGYITGNAGSLRTFSPLNNNPILVDTTLNVTGIALVKEELSVFPNPAKNQFSIQVQSNFEGEIKIMMKDMNGKEMMSIQANKTKGKFTKSIDCSKLTNGIYFLHLSFDRRNLIRKVIVLN